MTTAIARDPIYRRRRFPSETIELYVRWYLTYRLSYRDLVEMMAERGITLSHFKNLWAQALERDDTVSTCTVIRSRPVAATFRRGYFWGYPRKAKCENAAILGIFSPISNPSRGASEINNLHYFHLNLLRHSGVGD
jgi:hypothetical protein